MSFVAPLSAFVAPLSAQIKSGVGSLIRDLGWWASAPEARPPIRPDPAGRGLQDGLSKWVWALFKTQLGLLCRVRLGYRRYELARVVGQRMNEERTAILLLNDMVAAQFGRPW